MFHHRAQRECGARCSLSRKIDNMKQWNSFVLEFATRQKSKILNLMGKMEDRLNKQDILLANCIAHMEEMERPFSRGLRECVQELRRDYLDINKRLEYTESSKDRLEKDLTDNINRSLMALTEKVTTLEKRLEDVTAEAVKTSENKIDSQLKNQSKQFQEQHDVLEGRVFDCEEELQKLQGLAKEAISKGEEVEEKLERQMRQPWSYTRHRQPLRNDRDKEEEEEEEASDDDETGDTRPPMALEEAVTIEIESIMLKLCEYEGKDNERNRELDSKLQKFECRFKELDNRLSDASQLSAEVTRCKKMEERLQHSQETLLDHFSSRMEERIQKERGNVQEVADSQTILSSRVEDIGNLVTLVQIDIKEQKELHHNEEVQLKVLEKRLTQEKNDRTQELETRLAQIGLGRHQVVEMQDLRGKTHQLETQQKATEAAIQNQFNEVKRALSDLWHLSKKTEHDLNLSVNIWMGALDGFKRDDEMREKTREKRLQTLGDSIDGHRLNLGVLKKEVTYISEDMCTQAQRLTSLEFRQSQPRLGFCVRTTDAILTTSGSSLKLFQEVTTNKGDHYNKSTGIFTVPEKGLYLISLTHTQSLQAEINLAVVRETDQPKSEPRMLLAQTWTCQQFSSSSDSSLVELEPGQRLSLQAVHLQGFPRLCSPSSFSCFLIR